MFRVDMKNEFNNLLGLLLTGNDPAEVACL
jgi:hypothetical protein